MPRFPDLPFAVRFATYAYARGEAARALAAYYFVTNHDREHPVSDRAIARHCGVHPSTIAAWRREWEKGFDAAVEWEREHGRDLAEELATAYGLDMAKKTPNDSHDAGGPT